jgi:hypothetical protein
MADMTAKHHTLIADAIVAGAVNAAHSIAEAGKHVWEDTNVPSPYRVEALYQRFRNQMVQAVCERLRFTHDKFVPGEFSRKVPTNLKGADHYLQTLGR